ncbi:hypothetical protein [Streptomyces sp. NPDC005438]|uniref:hypothetical protein n=1 Tax=Streptomyces sp. NPDC005438 TaxID=3156880 RepID=UPI0033B99632
MAEDHGPRNRWQLADVARLAPRRTVDQAVTLADTWLAAAPGCALVTVPVRGWATVFRTRDEGALALHARGRPRECGLCVHPWLAQGHRLRGLAQRAGFGGESRVS